MQASSACEVALSTRSVGHAVNALKVVIQRVDDGYGIDSYEFLSAARTLGNRDP